jgi:hypothetical protein
VCVCVHEMRCLARWLIEPYYSSRAQVKLGEYIEVMAHSYSGPYQVSMLYVVPRGVDLSAMMTSMTLVWPSCLGHTLHTCTVVVWCQVARCPILSS